MKPKIFAAILAVSLITPKAFSQSNGSFGGKSQITGLVRYGKSNAPAENVLVRLEAYIGGHVGDVQTDRSGKFVFTGLLGQEYDITIAIPGYLPVKEHVDLQTVITGFVNIQLMPDPARSSEPKPNLDTADAKVSDSARKELERARATLDNPQKVRETITHLEKAVSLSPDFADAQLLLGTVYMDTQQWDRAQPPLQQALKTKPDSVAVLLALGELYLHTQKYKEAQDCLGKALSVDDNSFRGHLALGRTFYASGDLAKAGIEVDRAIGLKPDFAEANLLAGNIRFKNRQADKALPFFEQYLKLQPDGAYAKETNELVARIKKALGVPQQNRNRW